MFPKERKTAYEPLPETEGESEFSPQATNPSDGTTSPRRPKSIGTGHLIIISIEIILGALILAAFIVLVETPRPSSRSDVLDGLWDLRESYNTTGVYKNQTHLLRYQDEEADGYWRGLLKSGGVVSLNTEWAREQGLPVSTVSPTDDTQSIYQVDVFHALHCMNALRQMFSPNPTVWSPKHMAHCMDYIRHELLCHADLTLIPTRDLDEFDLDSPHQCTDFSAIEDWVDRHRWAEFTDWLKAKTTS